VSDTKRQLPLSKNIACLLRQRACSTELRRGVQYGHIIACVFKLEFLSLKILTEKRMLSVRLKELNILDIRIKVGSGTVKHN
jgi:hypothetical protein